MFLCECVLDMRSMIVIHCKVIGCKYFVHTKSVIGGWSVSSNCVLIIGATPLSVFNTITIKWSCATCLSWLTAFPNNHHGDDSSWAAKNPWTQNTETKTNTNRFFCSQPTIGVTDLTLLGLGWSWKVQKVMLKSLVTLYVIGINTT